jgi:predicted choloylglycine hydrolase
MTPKEKAFELYNKFYMAIPSDEMGLSDEASRQCALIAVDEVLYALSFHSDTELGETYWNEVKKEIEAL